MASRTRPAPGLRQAARTPRTGPGGVVVEEMLQGQQAAPGALQDRDATGPQPGGGDRVDSGRHVAEHHDGLAGPPRGLGHRDRVGVVPVELVHQVDGERHRAHRRVVGQGGQRAGQLLLGAGPGAPHVERVGGLQTRVEQGGQPRRGLRADRRERHPQLVGHVGHMGPFQPGVVHGRDARAHVGVRGVGVSTTEGEQFQRVGHLGQVADPVHAVRGGQRLPPAVRRGQRAGVGRHQGPAACRAARGEHHHRDAALARGGQHRAQPARFPDGLQDQRQHPGLRQAQRVLRVLGRSGDQFLAGGHGDREAQPAPGAQQGGEHRARVRDQCDRAAGERVRLHVPDRAQAVGHVDEAHAARTADRHARGARRGGQPAAQVQRRAGLRVRLLTGSVVRVLTGLGVLVLTRSGVRVLARQLVRAAEQHRGAVPPARRQGQLLLHGRIGHGHQHQVHWPRQVGQGRVAGPSGDPLVPGVDQVDLGLRRALGDLADHPLAQAARPWAGPDQGHGAGLQHRGQSRTVRHPGRRKTGDRGGGTDVAHGVRCGQ